MRDGSYAYRFDGASMAEGTAYHLVGIGRMRIAKGKIAGAHRSSIMPLKGRDAVLTTTQFRLSGTAKADAKGFTAAAITFVCTNASQNGEALQIEQILTGTFAFVPSGKDRYWLIGTGAHNKSLDSWAAEAVSGEAVRVGA